MSTDAIYYDLRGSSDLIKRIEERKMYVTLGGIPKNKLVSRNCNTCIQ